MMATFVSQCEKNSLKKTRRVLDAFADRIGDNTWTTERSDGKEGRARWEPRLRKVKKHEHPANQDTNAKQTPVGAHPSVRPEEPQRQIKNQAQTHDSESKRQTRGSAPTAVSTTNEVAQP